jgi:serine phosphatase RsbU (regulator of sigma subunit)
VLGVCSVPVSALDLFWELPSLKAPSRVSYSASASNGEAVTLSWQERTGTGAASAVNIYVDTARLDAPNTDTRWTGRQLVHGPILLAGVTEGGEPRMHAIAMNERRILVAVVLPIATGAEGSEVMIKSSEDGGRTFHQVASFTARTVVTSPSLSLTADGGWLLMLTQPEKLEGATEKEGKLSIAFSASDDGEHWDDLKPMVTEAILTQNIQPHHVVLKRTDYVVFQSKRITNHLYLKRSTDGGHTWPEPARAITSGDDFNNQRPYIAPMGNHLALAWERTLVGSDQPQIYYCEIEGDGTVVRPMEPVTRGGGAMYPQLVPIGGELRLLYTERQLGQTRLMLAARSGSGDPALWNAVSVAPSLESDTLVPHGAVLAERLFAFSEVKSSKYDWTLFAIRPDTSAPAPVLRPLDFSPGAPANRDRVTVGWSEPEDPSRISAYRYTWRREGAEAKTAELAGGPQQLAIDAPADGSWTLAVRSVDRAGNISATPSAITFVRDATPPAMVTMFLQPAPLLDGYQESNDFTISWVAPAGDVIARYEVSTPLLSNPLLSDGGSVVRQPESLRAVNVDDGDYTVTVSAVDQAGNIGPPAAITLRLNRYNPVTSITRVDERRDSGGNLQLRIVGLGFTAGRTVDEVSTVQEVYIDRDGVPPYDYTLTRSAGKFVVSNDQLIEGIVMGADYDTADYRIGVRHPVRGVRFAPQPLAFQAPGTVKLGDFSFRWAPRWAAARSSRYHVPFVTLLVALAAGLVAVLLVASSRSLVSTAREGAVLKAEVQALLEGRPPLITVEETERKLRSLHRRGVGLRLKFSLLVSVLVILIVAGVALPLSQRILGREQSILADELLNRSNLLLDSAAARAALPLRRGLSGIAIVSNIPVSIGVMPKEALDLTITGQSVSPSEGPVDPVDRDYLWATNDHFWPPGSFDPGRTRFVDKLSTSGQVGQLMKELNEDAATELNRTLADIRRLKDESDRLSKISLLRNATQADEDAYQAKQKEYAQALVDARSTINELAKKPGRVGIVPEFDPRSPVDEYLLYRPVVDFVQDGHYALGMVRLTISTAEFNRQITEVSAELRNLMVVISLAAIAAGVVGAVILAGITIGPVRKLAAGVAKIRDTENLSQLQDIDVGTRDEIGTLAEAVNEMTHGLVQAAKDKAELLVGKDLQKKFLPLEGEGGAKGSTGGRKTAHLDIYGYYEGAKGVSGDYFDFQQLDDRYLAIINCDVAGKGVPAAMIMVEVATLFLGWCRDWRKTGAGRASVGRRDLDALVYTINDMLEERGFKGRFAALTVALFDLEAGDLTVCTAGSNVLHVFDASRGEILPHPLPETPAAGVFPSLLIRAKSGFPQVRLPLDRGDAMFLFTDGFEESKRSFRAWGGDIVPCAEAGLQEGERHLETHARGLTSEEFGVARISGVINAVFARGSYRLVRHHTAIREDLEFDFSGCDGTVKEAVLALVCVEKVFRIYRDALTGPGDIVRIETKLDGFLSDHFRGYDTLFDHRFEGGIREGSVAFSHLKEEPQYDDLTLLVVRRP